MSRLTTMRAEGSLCCPDPSPQPAACCLNRVFWRALGIWIATPFGGIGMKRGLLYLGIAGALVITCATVSRTWRRDRAAHSAHSVAHIDASPIRRTRDWRVKQPSGNNKGPDRTALFQKSVECGYVERWGDQGSAHFVVFLINPDHGESDPSVPDNQYVEYVNGYEDLETAKRVTEHLCDAK